MNQSKQASSKIRVFCCYAYEDLSFLEGIKKHLKPLELEGSIIVQADIDISAGMEWKREIDRRLEAAEIILLLISPDFMNSYHCVNEDMHKALIRHKQGTARVVPVIIRPTDYQRMPFGMLLSLPKEAKPISMWQDRDDAFLSVAKGIRTIVLELTATTIHPDPTPYDPPIIIDPPLDRPLGEGIVSLKKGERALWDGGYIFAKRELRKAIAELDTETHDEEAAKARYLFALALLNGKLPRTQGKEVMQSIEELMSSAINIHPYASYYRILACIKKDHFTYNGLLNWHINEVHILEHKGVSFPRCINDEENEEYFRHSQPRLQL